MRSELCVCGDWIVAASPDAIREAVWAHNAGLTHRRYRQRRRRVETTRAWRARLRAEIELIRLRRWAATQGEAA